MKAKKESTYLLVLTEEQYKVVLENLDYSLHNAPLKGGKAKQLRKLVEQVASPILKHSTEIAIKLK